MTSILIIYVWMYFSIFCHEIGHFIFAKLAGMSPYLVQVGTGYKFLKLQLFNTVFEFRILPYGGMTQAYHLTLDSFKVRFLLFAIGGVFANFLLVGFLITLLRIQRDLLILILIIFEFVFLFSNLTPTEFKIYNQIVQSDGQLIICALTINYQKIYQDISEEYKKQSYRYKNDKAILPETFLGNDLRTLQIFIDAQKKLYSHAYEEAVKLFIQVLNFKKISNCEKVFILDNLSCIVVMHGYKKYLNDADRWSEEAIKLASYSKTLKGTRGAILVELGRYDEGKQLLLPLTEPENDALDIAVSSCYIAKAEYFLGNIERVNAWLANAKEIGGADANKVLKRIQKEINYHV